MLLRLELLVTLLRIWFLNYLYRVMVSDTMITLG